jgi:hypothetical protein
MIASSISSVLGTLMVHPLDTIRVRMITSTEQIGTLQLLYKSIAKEGFSCLYKGI